MGSKKILTESLKKNLERKTTREIRNRAVVGTVLEKYKTLIDSFDKVNYTQYETLHHKWGTSGRKRQVMLDIVLKENIQGPIKELAELADINTQMSYYGITSEDIPFLAEESMKQTRLLVNNPREITQEIAEDIYQKVL